MKLFRWILILGLFVSTTLSGPGPAVAGLATLVADHVRVLGNNRLVAEGNVVVLYQDYRLTARRVIYDEFGDTLEIEGPITLSRGENTAFFADYAQLSSDLREGLLQSARLVLHQQLQIAAVEINRIQGRYTQMTKAVVSSCKVCASNPVPLWEIRASRVIHDETERQLYFHDAQLRFMDLPVFYLPRLRLPDPSLTRATGFLTPRIRSNSQIGLAIYTPYFIRLGDHADLTLAPLLSSRTATLEARYRQAFRFGAIELNGAVSRDKIVPGMTRYYLIGAGRFDLPKAFRLDLQIEQASDPSYLSDYGYSDADRLRNAIEISRARRNEYFYGGLVRNETLRASELPIVDQLPFAQADMIYERRLPGVLGGEAQLQVSAHGHYRASNLDMLGRDMARIGATASWQRDWLLSNGIIAGVEGALTADAYGIYQDSSFTPYQSHLTPGAALSLRWPMARMTAGGATEVLQPVAQFAWSGAPGPMVPNEDSVMVEFDEANLFDLSRFPGHDRVESGARANFGLSWTRYDPSGWVLTLTGGKVLRQTDPGQFAPPSGLDGVSSDWLVAGQLNLDSQVFLQSRALISDSGNVTKAETRAAWQGDKLGLSTGHIWVIADPNPAGENRPDPIHEWLLDASYQLTPGWRASADWRFDIVANEATKAGVGLEYRNECISVDLSLSRSFTSSTSVSPTTKFGLAVNLIGFGGAASGPARRCGG